MQRKWYHEKILEERANIAHRQYVYDGFICIIRSTTSASHANAAAMPRQKLQGHELPSDELQK